MLDRGTVQLIILVVSVSFNLAYIIGRWMRGTEGDATYMRRDLEILQKSHDTWVTEMRARTHKLQQDIQGLPEHLRPIFVPREVLALHVEHNKNTVERLYAAFTGDRRHSYRRGEDEEHQS